MLFVGSKSSLNHFGVILLGQCQVLEACEQKQWGNLINQHEKGLWAGMGACLGGVKLGNQGGDL